MALSKTLESISLGKIVVIREALMQAQAEGRRVFRFESGDPSFSVAPHILAAIEKAGREGKTHYIPNDGIPELRTALFEKLRTKNRIPVQSPKDIYVTNGAMHALFVTFGCLLDDGDEVLLPDPMWTEVAENIRLAGGIPVGVPLAFAQNYEYDLEALAQRITPRTKAIFLNTPHNPTGAILSQETLEGILELARAHDLFIVSDEAYEDVIYPGYEHRSIASLAKAEDQARIISIWSFSKSYAMSGLRVGVIHTPNPTLKAKIPKLLRCTINGVNSLAQWGALAAVTGPQDALPMMRDEYLHRRDILVQALAGIPGLRTFAPRGGFCLWVELERSFLQERGLANADELSSRLAAQGLGSAPGDAFGITCEHAIRFAFSCDTRMVVEGAPLLRQALLETPSSVRPRQALGVA